MTWWVLSVDGNEALLLADKNLDAKALKGQKLTVKWKKVGSASGYQFQYAANSRFSGAKTVLILM